VNTPKPRLDRKYITRKRLRERYGDISEMTLWRWEHDKKLGLPDALGINPRKYYDLDAIEAWERRRAAVAIVPDEPSAICPPGAQSRIVLEILTPLEKIQAALDTHQTHVQPANADTAVVAEIDRIRCSLHEVIEAIRSLFIPCRALVHGSTP